MRFRRWWLGAFCLLVPLFITSSAEAFPDSEAASEVVRIVITSDKVEPGNDGWVEFTDGTNQWVSPTCRAVLLADGIEMVVLTWPEISSMPHHHVDHACGDLRPPPEPPAPTDSTDPDGKISTPSYGEVVSEAVTLSGTASDNVGVASVRLTIWNRTAQTWNGTSFTSAYTSVPAAVVPAGGSSVSWSYDMVGVPDGPFVFRATAFDEAGNFDKSRKWRLVRVSGAADDVAPNSVTFAPAAESTVTGPVTFTGTASDNVGVAQVLLTIYNIETAETWDGSAFTADFTRVSAAVTPVGGTSATWSYDMVDMGEVSVAFSVMALDAAGNFDRTRPWRYIEIVEDNTGGGLTAAENLDLILANETRNTQFDDNPFRGVPMADIEVSDLTIVGDEYNEGLLDTTNSGYFRVKCEISHFAYDDPIIFPNQPGRAHLHMFFGNTEANAFSTFDSLLNTGTGSCNGADLNRTAYWVPALLDTNGNALIPYEVMVYYKNDNFLLNGANELVNPFPDNLRMIAGRGSATAPQTESTGGAAAPWARPAIEFSCGPAYNSNNQGPLIPDCYGTGNGPFGNNGRALEMSIAFPQCFNEDAGTYLADQSHMSYSINGYYGSTCPDSHPTDVSSIMYRIFYSPDEYGGALTDLVLSSDVKMDQILPGGTTAHADWFGAWHPEAMDLWVQNCNNMQADCEIGLLDTDPFLSLVPRDENNDYGSGYLAPATELIKLCPGKVFDANDPLRSVAMCRMG